MAINASKRQKKLEKRKAKEKAKRKEIVRRQSQGMPGRLQAAANAPILHCCYTSTLWTQGIGHVLVSRQLPSGNVAFVAFLVDVYCLGVKDVFYNVIPRVKYEERMYRDLLNRCPLKNFKPEAARKLVEDAVEYAMKLGLPPHPDYRVGKLIFGDIDASACTEEFKFGKNGRPYFFRGPYDDMARCRTIHNALEAACGPGNYDFVIPMQGLGDLVEFDRFDANEEGEEYVEEDEEFDEQ